VQNEKKDTMAIKKRLENKMLIQRKWEKIDRTNNSMYTNWAG
jgi:hypothetical protein